MKNYNDLTTEEKLACVSLYPDEAKKDENWLIRLEAYRALEFTDEAKKDEDGLIHREAEIYFRIKQFFSNELQEEIKRNIGLLRQWLNAKGRGSSIPLSTLPAFNLTHFKSITGDMGE